MDHPAASVYGLHAHSVYVIQGAAVTPGEKTLSGEVENEAKGGRSEQLSIRAREGGFQQEPAGVSRVSDCSVLCSVTEKSARGLVHT